MDLTHDIPAQLSALAAGGTGRLVGIRHRVQIDPDPEWLGRAEVGRGLEELADAGLCFDLVLRWWQLPVAARVAAEHPSLTFVLDQLGGPSFDGGSEMDAWEKGLRALAGQPNSVAKLSGLGGTLGRTDWSVDDLRPALDVAVSAFGPTRLMYGSDWPLVELNGGAPRWHNAVAQATGGMSGTESEAIRGRTASRVYGMDAA